MLLSGDRKANRTQEIVCVEWNGCGVYRTSKTKDRGRSQIMSRCNPSDLIKQLHIGLKEEKWCQGFYLRIIVFGY